MMETYKDILIRKKDGEVEYLTFPRFENVGMVEHLMSTRIGGVSSGIFSSMNFSVLRGDKKENVLENYDRIAKILQTDKNRFVCSDQTHTTNIRKVTAADAGKGTILEKDYQDIDGLITNEKGLTLVIFYADCVPLLFLDPVHKAIGMAHSGWRGTVAKIGQEVLQCMRKEYHTRPEDVLCGIGPSICQKCYEVDADVAEKFRVAFKGKEERILQGKKKVPNKKQEEKYQLDLWMANKEVLLEAGVSEKNIEISGLCTCCNPSYLFSHRASQGKRGIMAAFMKLS